MLSLRLHAQSKHCEVYLFVDRESGKTSDRVEVQKLFEYATRREFQFVLVWALDRFIGEGVAEAFLSVQKLVRYEVPRDCRIPV